MAPHIVGSRYCPKINGTLGVFDVYEAAVVVSEEEGQRNAAAAAKRGFRRSAVRYDKLQVWPCATFTI